MATKNSRPQQPAKHCIIFFLTSGKRLSTHVDECIAVLKGHEPAPCVNKDALGCNRRQRRQTTGTPISRQEAVMWETLLIEQSDGVATLTVNRPKQLNALNEQVLRDIISAAEHIRTRPDINVVIVTGAGDKAFIAGADIAVMAELDSDQAQAFTTLGQNAMNALAGLEVPVIAAVNGFALGGGHELMLACDIRFAADTAKFGQPEVGLGILASFGGTQRLPRLIGPGRAKYLLFSAEVIGAAKALEFGIVDVVVPKDELMATVRAFAERICKQKRFAVCQTKKCVNYGLDSNMATGLAYEVQAYGLCYTKPEREQSMREFLNKKK